MHYHTARPTPTVCIVLGAVGTAAYLAVLARVLHTYTTFTLAEPFATITFVVAAAWTFVGPLAAGWFVSSWYRRSVGALRAEIEQLRAERRSYETLKESIEKVDAQAEVNTVLTRKVLKAVEEDKNANEDTQDIPRPRRLHGIDGGA